MPSWENVVGPSKQSRAIISPGEINFVSNLFYNISATMSKKTFYTRNLVHTIVS